MTSRSSSENPTTGYTEKIDADGNWVYEMENELQPVLESDTMGSSDHHDSSRRSSISKVQEAVRKASVKCYYKFHELPKERTILLFSALSAYLLSYVVLLIEFLCYDKRWGRLSDAMKLDIPKGSGVPMIIFGFLSFISYFVTLYYFTFARKNESNEKRWDYIIITEAYVLIPLLSIPEWPLEFEMLLVCLKAIPEGVETIKNSYPKALFGLLVVIAIFRCLFAFVIPYNIITDAIRDEEDEEENSKKSNYHPKWSVFSIVVIVASLLLACNIVYTDTIFTNVALRRFLNKSSKSFCSF